MSDFSPYDSNSGNYDDYEAEETSILPATGLFPTLIQSLDACLNFLFMSSPVDHTTHTNNNTAKNKSQHDEIQHIKTEQEQLQDARCKLLQLSSSFSSLNGEQNFDRNSKEEKRSSNKVSNNRFYSKIQHCQQSDVWDCGVTCILMFIRYLKDIETGSSSRTQNNDNDYIVTDESSCLENSTHLNHLEMLQKNWLVEQLKTNSIWTIDLVMLLETIFNHAPPRLKLPKRKLENGSNIQYLYCSNNLGVDTSYQSLNYYNNSFGKDAKRVNKLFSLAQTNSNIQMLKISHIDIDFVIEIVSRDNCIAIVLLDYSELYRYKRQNNNYELGEQQYGATSNNNDNVVTCFSGHYIILCGISKNEKDIAQAMELNSAGDMDQSFCFVIADPGCAHNYTYVGKEIFEKSWRARGTDCDILFLAVNQQ